MEAVFNYFSEPKFRENGFSPKYEHDIRIGTYTPRPDVVLFDRQGNLVAIAECKRGGITSYGIEQLKSYLTASDTQFGIFANSHESNEWIFFENLRRYHFKNDISRSKFETGIVEDQPIESIRQEKNKLDGEIQKARDQYAQKTRAVDSSCKQLDELNEKITQAGRQLASLEEEINPLKKESSDLKKEIKQHSEQVEVCRGLKLKSTRDSLARENKSLIQRNSGLQYEIQKRKDQEKNLTGKIDILNKDTDELERKKQEDQKKIRQLRQEYEIKIGKRDQIHQEYRKYKRLSEYNKAINDDLDGRIKQKRPLVRELESYEQIESELKRLDGLESEIARKQELAQEDQERHAAYERNVVEINRKRQQRIQVSQERERILKKVRVAINRLKIAAPEQKAQKLRNIGKLAQNLRKQKCVYDQFTNGINQLKEAKLKLETEIKEKLQGCSQERRAVCPTYIQIQVEIDNLKAEKSKLEAEIGHRIFILQSQKD